MLARHQQSLLFFVGGVFKIFSYITSVFGHDCLQSAAPHRKTQKSRPSVCMYCLHLLSVLPAPIRSCCGQAFSYPRPLPEPVMDSVLYLSYSVGGTDKAALEMLSSSDFCDTSPIWFSSYLTNNSFPGLLASSPSPARPLMEGHRRRLSFGLLWSTFTLASDVALLSPAMSNAIYMLMTLKSISLALTLALDIQLPTKHHHLNV